MGVLRGCPSASTCHRTTEGLSQAAAGPQGEKPLQDCSCVPGQRDAQSPIALIPKPEGAGRKAGAWAQVVLGTDPPRPGSS